MVDDVIDLYHRRGEPVPVRTSGDDPINL